MIIEPGHISMDHGKTTAVANWPQPRNLRDVRGFLRFANFYRRFIQNFSAKARPLNDLTKKDTPWRWGTDEEAAFVTFKRAFAEAPVLVLYDHSRPTEVEVNTSNFATGGVLLQKGDDGLWHLIVY